MTEPRIPTTKIGRIREWFAAAREGAIATAIVATVVILLFLLVWPSRIGRIAEEVGIKSVSVLGFDIALFEKNQKQIMEALNGTEQVVSALPQFKAQLRAISKERQPSPEDSETAASGRKR